MIRALEPKDVGKLREIHDKFFKHEFPFPDFFKGFLCSFAITDDDDDTLICVGAVRPIAEVFAITNKDETTRTRRQALYQILEASSYISSCHGFDQLHCFIQDDPWEKQLLKAGFRPTKGHSLVMDVS
jgi:hypothetical protein